MTQKKRNGIVGTEDYLESKYESCRKNKKNFIVCDRCKSRFLCWTSRDREFDDITYLHHDYGLTISQFEERMMRLFELMSKEEKLDE